MGMLIRLYVIFLCSFLLSCQKKSADNAFLDAEVVELEEFDTIVSYEDGTLANPSAIRYDGDSLLYVYDAEKYQVLALDGSGQIVRKYGGQCRGPGEFLSVSSFYLTDNYLYIVDLLQFQIKKYTLDGEVNGSLDYGKKSFQPLLPPAPQSLIQRAKIITNEPFVTTSGNVLLPAIQLREDYKV